MNQNLKNFLVSGALLLMPVTVFAQQVVSHGFSVVSEKVSYEGKIRYMDSRVIVRAVLKIKAPADSPLGRYAESVSQTTLESFQVPAGTDEKFLWDMMEAKQFLTVAQGIFLSATRFYTVGSPIHGRMLAESQKYFRKSGSLFSKCGKYMASEEVIRIVNLLEQIKANTNERIADKQFAAYYGLCNNLNRACVRLEKDFNEKYQCITLK